MDITPTAVKLCRKERLSAPPDPSPFLDDHQSREKVYNEDASGAPPAPAANATHPIQFLLLFAFRQRRRESTEIHKNLNCCYFRKLFLKMIDKTH